MCPRSLSYQEVRDDRLVKQDCPGERQPDSIPRDPARSLDLFELRCTDSRMNALLTHAMTHTGHKSQMQSAWSIVLLTRFSSESPGNYDPILRMRKLMSMIFALPPEGSVCLFIRFCWNHLLLLEEEKPPFPEGLQTRASFSQCYLLLNNQPKLRGLKQKLLLSLEALWVEWAWLGCSHVGTLVLASLGFEGSSAQTFGTWAGTAGTVRPLSPHSSAWTRLALLHGRQS